MNVEHEAKLKIESHAPVRAALAERGARCLGQWREFNALYDTTQTVLRDRMMVLRLRQFTPEDGPVRPAVLTVKGPAEPGRFKRREEFEVEVSDADTMHAMLLRLGFSVFASFEKRRESWLWQDCQVDLDLLPLLGTYLEIEGPDEKTIAACQRDLGLAHLDHESASYLAMLFESCRVTGKPPLDLRLPAAPAQ